MSDSFPVFVVQHNHFDPIWRRCWRRSFDYKGVRYNPYADLEEYFINIWLENARKGAVWSEGQAVVFREYLDRYPDTLPEMQQMVSDGLIELTAAGETVPDLNMPAGETLLRNLALGQWWFSETFGVIPTIGWLEDAFGQSAQVPQIYRSCQCTSLQKLSYKRVPGEYWRGLDGSTIYTGGDPHATYTGGGIKIPPCPHCNGIECDECSYPGLSDQSKVSDEELRNAFNNHTTFDPYSMIYIGGEEAVPNPNIVDLLNEAREKRGIDFRFGGFETIARYAADKIARIDDPSLEVSDQIEANPVSTGCYVSRIRIKQAFRVLESVLLAAETFATMAYLFGADYLDEELRESWRTLTFAAFHDAITSTHIDSAFHELLDMFQNALETAVAVSDESLAFLEAESEDDEPEDAVIVWNSHSWERTEPVTFRMTNSRGTPSLTAPDGSDVPVLDAISEGGAVTVTFVPPAVPAFGYTTIAMDYDAEPVNSGETTHGPGTIENEFYRMEVSDRGITSLVDLATGKDFLDNSNLLLNELILEEDIGHPWGTMQMPSFSEPLSKYTTSVSIRRAAGLSEVVLTGTYKGSDEAVKILNWRQSVTMYNGVRRIDCRTSIDWDTAQRRIRIAFPTPYKSGKAMYSIPYGAIERKPYEPDMSGYPSTNGDWPAVYWVDVAEQDGSSGLALMNIGTPSHKVEDGVIYMSVLRSPTDSWCLNEPEFYDCPDFDGARDEGSHQFFYSVLPHTGSWVEAGVEKAARAFNSPCVVRRLDFRPEDPEQLTHSIADIEASPGCIVTALKKSEQGDALIARVAETSGVPGTIRLNFQGTTGGAQLVDSLEMNPKPCPDIVKLRPFQIATIRFPVERD